MNQNSNGQNTFIIRPVGYIETHLTDQDLHFEQPEDPIQRKKELKNHLRRLHDQPSTIRILPAFERQLDGIEAFSHITVLFWPHQLPEERRNQAKVHPRGWRDLPETGVFATHSPARPNPILTSTVRLMKRDGLYLHVAGLDAFDGTPVIDLKPLITGGIDLKNYRVPDWVKKMIE